MEYVRDVLGYYFKNFFYLILLALVPAVFLGLLVEPFGIYQFVFDYHDMTFFTFGDFFWQVFGLTWYRLIYIVLGLGIFVISASLILGFIEHHFRVGDRSLRSSFSLNNNALGVFKTTLILCVVSFVLNLIAMLLMFFIHYLGANDGVGSIFSNIINYVIVLGLMVLFGRGLSLFGYATVEMLLEGSPIMVGLSNGMRAMGKRGIQLFITEIIIMGSCFVIMIVFSALKLALLGNVLSCLVFISLLCVNSMVLFFDTNHHERMDKLKYYQRK